MKKYLLPLILLFILSATCNAQQRAKQKDVILYMPFASTEKSLPEIISLTSSVDGVTPVAFCEDFKCLLIQVDQNNHSNELKFYEQLKKANVKFDIKHEASIAAVLKECKKAISAETQWQ